MHENRLPGGSTTRWGPLFGGRARDWAETWEGPQGWGIPVYGLVLDHAQIGPGTSVLDCGCGAGRFAQMAADRGASVAGIDAARELFRRGYGVQFLPVRRRQGKGARRGPACVAGDGRGGDP